MKPVCKALLVVGFCSAALLASADSCSEADGGQCAADAAGDSNIHMQLKQKVKVLENSKKPAAKSSTAGKDMHKLPARVRSYPKFSRHAPRQPATRAAKLNKIRFQLTKKHAEKQKPRGSTESPTEFPTPPPMPECDWNTEQMCHDPAPEDCKADCFGKDYCVPASEGCPVKCMKGEEECTDTVGEHTYRWCSASPCPPKCDWDKETMCYEDPPPDCDASKGDCHGKQFCMPMSQGCPITCGKDEFKCHEEHDGYAWQWCQMMPCPPQCKDTEQMCYHPPPQDCTDAAGCFGYETCHPKDEACPVHCGPEENECTAAGYCDDCSPYSWCQSKDFPCPPTCKKEEMICSIPPPKSCYENWDDKKCHYKDECFPKDAGCPVTCGDGEIACTQKDGDYAWQYCHWGTSCPPQCEADEMQCWSHNPTTNPPEDTATCVKTFKRDGTYNFCPVTCYDPDIKCESEWGDYCTNPQWGQCW